LTKPHSEWDENAQPKKEPHRSTLGITHSQLTRLRPQRGVV
jgi:hypothetical protein